MNTSVTPSPGQVISIQSSSPSTALQQLSPIRAPNFLIEGPTGTGKSHCIRTLAKAGIECFVLMTERNSMETLGQFPYIRRHYMSRGDYSWRGLRGMAENISRYDQETLMKIQDPAKGSCLQTLEFLDALSNFKDDLTGNTYGDVSTWGTGRAIIVDGLTGFNNFTRGLIVGGRPILHLAEWQIWQNTVYPILEMLTVQTRCWVVVLAHLEMEKDELTGGIKAMTSTPGKKLAPTIPPLFTDVVRAKRVGTEFTWSTADPQTDLAARNLPISDKITPDFGPVVKDWVKKGGIIEVSPTFQPAT